MKCPSALVLTVNTCFSSPLLICVYVVYVILLTTMGQKKQKIKYFCECCYSKIKLPLIHIFHPHYYYLQTCNFLNWKNFLWNFALNVHHTLGKDFFLWIWKSQHTVHIYFTQSTFWLYIWIGYIPKCIIHCNLNRTIIYILFTCWHKKYIFQWRNRIIHIPKSYTIFKIKVNGIDLEGWGLDE